MWKLYDTIDNPETKLFDSVVSEFNKIAGFPVEFWSLELSGGVEDEIYGENPNQKWAGPFKTQTIYEPTGEPELIGMFGITSDDIIETMQIPKSVFTEDTGYEVPKAGDLIKTLWNNKTYEIAEVKSERNIFLGHKMIWDLICKPFRYDYQSESADKFLFDLPEEVDFPDINITTETETYSISSSPSGDIIQQQYGDNDIIEDEKYYQSDTSIYGY